MENEKNKLTLRRASRYDKDMSDTATIEKPQLLPDIRQDVYETWKEDLANADSSTEREGIWAAIKSGIPKGVQEAKDMADEEIKRITDEMSEREKKERKRTEVERNIDAFVKDLEDSPGLVKEGMSHPKDVKNSSIIKEILREKTEADMSEIGWGKEDKAELITKLQAKFKNQLNDDQVLNITDLLVATGRTAKNVLQDIDTNTTEFDVSDEELERSRSTREEISALKKLNWFAGLQIHEKSIKRFILQDEFAAENEDTYQRTDPGNIEEIAWQVMHHYKHETWGPNGTFPLLEMRIGYIRDKDGNIQKDENGNNRVDPSKSKYYLNQANFVRWARERMWNLWDINNDVGDFISAIDLPKSYGTMNFGKMFPEYVKYFASEDGDTKYWLMAQELIIESWGLGTMNQMATKYKQTMNDPKKLQEAIGEMFAGNTFTKETFRKNLFQLMSIIPLNYDGNKPGELLSNDGIFGSAMIDMFLVYYNLSDFDELQKILGKGSSFFTRDGYIQALQTVVSDKVTESSGESKPVVLNAQTQGWFEKAFDKNGQISTQENRDNFIKLINFFAIKTDNPDQEYTVRRMLYKVTSEKYGRVLKRKKLDQRGEPIKVNGEQVWEDDDEKLFLTDPVTGKTKAKIVKKYGLTSDIEGKNNDEWSLKMMWVASSAMSRIFGAGMRNDTAAAGYDAMSKMHFSEVYRGKMLGYGRGMGNPYTVPQFKIFAMDPMNAILTDSFEEVKDENGKVIKKRQKPWRQVMEEIQHAMTAYTAELKQYERAYAEAPEEEKAQRKKELDEHIKKKNIKYQTKAGELSFRQRAMSNYYDDHLMRAYQTYEFVNHAEEMNMDNYITYEAWGGVHFNRAKFQTDVQDKIITPIRYFINTYPDIDYSAKFHMLDQAATARKRRELHDYTAAPIYRDMTLGEAMFGYELLNREAFWKTDKKGKYVFEKDKNGRDIKGLHAIDYTKVNDNKELLTKQYFLTKIAADLHAHRAFHSNDSRFNIDYYHSVIKAIESIPGSWDSDETNIRKAKVGNYFDKKDMRWFRKTVKVENYDLYLRAIFKDVFAPDDPQEGIGILSMLGIFTSAIVKAA